ncbi:GIY-YIG nuclease family protein [uncultured Ilyobacter sp.]|uniref:GIY-YIG nuclease family protein n=1 Tax=uncultured Ilyobacter sp. TaxID=544433 RepID=UPI0029C06D3C|nr:GIY-YIG nuclease family protein [uncultured Ilyobacter sp.]
MKIDLLLTALKDYSNCRIHLAKTAGGSRPLEVLARNDSGWKNWQKYKGGGRERFPEKHIITFAQISGNKFLFGGIFEITDRSGEEYDVELLDVHKDLIGRLVIEYSGDNKRGTAFTYDYIINNSKICELYPTRYRGEVFDSISVINHEYCSLETIVKNELPDWKTALSKVKGVYLLTDQNTGKHYVGSAYGNDGIWGRWSQYIYNYNGGNKELVQLTCEHGEEYFKNNFKFTVLETVGSSATDEEIIQKESLWKEKLMSKSFGYNAN